MAQSFDLQASRRYWRFVPSGLGKHDTSVLAHLPERDFEEVWDDAFDARFRNYPEEDAFLRLLAARLSGKKMLSVGSGLGLHEVYCARQGAAVSCCDIVESNLQVVARAGRLKGAPLRTVLGSGVGLPPLGETFDVALIYGSLMAMPADGQRVLLREVVQRLESEGSIILMLYTWEFAKDACGWASPEEFDPLIFARASDPSVGDEHCPWSDWHDDEKLLALCGPRLAIRRRQSWQHGCFAWYELAEGSRDRTPAPFFPLDRLAEGRLVRDLELASFEPTGAVVRASAWGHLVESRPSRSDYVLVSSVYEAVDDGEANALLVDLTLEQGGISVALLDADADRFLATGVFTRPGEHRWPVSVPHLPRRYRVIVSNHCLRAPEPSRFLLRGLRLLRRPTVVGEPRAWRRD